MQYSLIGLFAELDTDSCQTLSRTKSSDSVPFTAEDSLFAGEVKDQSDNFQADMAVIAGLYSGGVDFSLLPEAAGRLFELSVDAFSALVHGWMSELGIETEMLHFGRKVLAVNDRAAANRVTCDRGDPTMRLVLEVQQKVQHEVHRFQGLLRFSPNEDGVYVARFAPDYLILPALGDYFTQRFGTANSVGTAWAIIDEKRGLCLSSASCDSRLSTALPQIHQADGFFAAHPDKIDPWSDLWRHYHQTINNEGRSNPTLQRQFMPKRHWKYLPEMQN